jgi:hypothetical protein
MGNTILPELSTTEEQLTLFDTSIRPAVRIRLESASTLTEWSFSRRELMYQCLGTYYNKYYGAHAHRAKSEPRKQQLRFLKSLSNRHQRTGKILHLVISTYLKHFKDGDAWSLDRTLHWAREMFYADLQYSREFMRRYGRGRYDVMIEDDESNNGSRKPFLLAEFYYELEDAEELWKKGEERLLNALVNFVTHPDLAWFRAGAVSDGSLIEERLSLKEEHFRLTGRLDAAFRDEGRRAVVDWKIGEEGGGEDDLQLFSYSLPALKKFECAPEEMDLYKVFLTDAKHSKFTMSERGMMRTRARIIQDVERMRLLDPYGRDGVVEAFTPCRRPRVCANCPFQEVCPTAALEVTKE